MIWDYEQMNRLIKFKEHIDNILLTAMEIVLAISFIGLVLFCTLTIIYVMDINIPIYEYFITEVL